MLFPVKAHATIPITIIANTATTIFSWVGEMQFLADRLEGVVPWPSFNTARGYPLLGYPHAKTIHWIVLAPPPEFWEEKDALGLRVSASASVGALFVRHWRTAPPNPATF